MRNFFRELSTNRPIEFLYEDREKHLVEFQTIYSYFNKKTNFVFSCKSGVEGGYFPFP
jgi:hypothetical protein